MVHTPYRVCVARLLLPRQEVLCYCCSKVRGSGRINIRESLSKHLANRLCLLPNKDFTGDGPYKEDVGLRWQLGACATVGVGRIIYGGGCVNGSVYTHNGRGFAAADFSLRGSHCGAQC